jgi:hypothetical protein
MSELFRGHYIDHSVLGRTVARNWPGRSYVYLLHLENSIGMLVCSAAPRSGLPFHLQFENI